MATAETREIIKPVGVVVLTLSEDEADVLTTILANVGGPEESSPRKHASAMFHALNDVLEIDWYSGDIAKLVRGNIRFDNYPTE